MNTKKFKFKFLVGGIILLGLLLVIIYLNYPSRLLVDLDNTKSITIKLKEDTSSKSKKYMTKVTDKETIEKVVNSLNNVVYKKTSYLFDISALGNTGYSLEIVDNNGNIEIITIYFDDTIRIQSNGRYKINDGMAGQIYEDLLTICKTI
jgi:hypothetical protein